MSLFVALEKNVRPIREPAGVAVVDAVARDLPRLTSAGRQHDDRRRLAVARNRQNPLPVRRERFRCAVAEADGRGAVDAADVDAEDRAAGLARLGEDDGLAVKREIADDGVVEPGEI